MDYTEIERLLRKTRDPGERIALLAEHAGQLAVKSPNQAGVVFDRVIPQGRKLIREGHHRHEFLLVLLARGLNHFVLGEYTAASDIYDESLKFATRISDRELQVKSLEGLGSIAMSRCDYQEALGIFEKARQISEAVGYTNGVLSSINSIANIHGRLGQTIESRQLFLRAIAVARQAHERGYVAGALHGLGNCENDLGNYTEAIQAFLGCLEISQEMEDPYFSSLSLVNIGNVYAQLKDFTHAAEYFQRCLALCRSSGNQYPLGGTLISLGSLERERGNLAEATEYLNEGIALMRKLHDRSLEADGMGHLAAIATLQCRFEEADMLASDALRIKQEIGDERGATEMTLELARVQGGKGQFRDAIQLASTAIRKAEELQLRPLVSEGAELISGLWASSGNTPEALKWYKRYHELSEEVLRTEAERRIENLDAIHKRDVAEKRAALLDLEKEKMERELDLKAKHLTTMAMSIVQHTNFLDHLGRDLNRALKQRPKMQKEAIETVLRRVKLQSQSEHEWKQFEEQLKSLDHDFITNLATAYPNLSPTELKICALLKVNLGSKEMARVLSITLRSIETYRLRIRKKLGLPSATNLGSFIAGFH